MRNNLRDDGFSKEWAERAGRLALAEAEKPSQDTVVSFTNLGLFWYSQGQWRRSLVYEGYASLNSRALLLWSAADMSPLEAELSRRRFWASFLLNQFISEPVFPKILRNSVGDIPLPIPEEDYNSGNVPTPSATLNKGARDGSIFAELVRVMSLWVDIYETIKDSTHADPSGLAAIQVLSARLNEWHSQLRHPAAGHAAPRHVPPVPVRAALLHCAAVLAVQGPRERELRPRPAAFGAGGL